MQSLNYPVAGITSGCELFLRFITLASLDSVCINFILNAKELILFVSSHLLKLKKLCWGEGRNLLIN